MSKKELQKKRTKKYFIDAAKQIIAEEGIENLSVRKVGDIAGYSYATIYNYFKDLNHLLWYVAVDILEEIEKKLYTVVKTPDSSFDKLRKLNDVYISYYIDNPHAYYLLFLKQFSKPEDIVQDQEIPALANIVSTTLQQSVDEGFISDDEIPIITDLLIGTIHGLLLLYFSNKRQFTTEELYDKANRSMEYLLKK